jgi:hypothetical protein
VSESARVCAGGVRSDMSDIMIEHPCAFRMKPAQSAPSDTSSTLTPSSPLYQATPQTQTHPQARLRLILIAPHPASLAGLSCGPP